MDKSNLIQYRRLLDLRGTINQYELESIQEMLIVYNKSMADLEKRMKKTNSVTTKKQLKGVLRSIEDAHKTFKAAINETLVDTVATTGKEMSKGMANILSWDGKDKSFNIPANRVKKTLNAIENVPIGGKILNDWVEKVFDDTLSLQRVILASDVAGEGYKKLYSKLKNTYPDYTRKELITLARTYNQSIIVDEQERLFKANKDIVEKVRWSAIMETGFSSSGRGTCPRCAGLDGQEYTHDEEKPNCPLHARCRCMWVPVTVSWNDLFKKHDMKDKDGNNLTMEEMEGDYQKFLNRRETNIDVGRGAGNILNEEWTNKPYGQFITERGGEDLVNVVGPTRAKLIETGKLEFKDLVDRKTGELKTLKELGFDKVERSALKKGKLPPKNAQVATGETFGVPKVGEYIKGIEKALYKPYHAELLKRDASYELKDAGPLQGCCYYAGRSTIYMRSELSGTLKGGQIMLHEFGHRVDNIYANKFLSEGWGNKSSLPANRWVSCSDKWVSASNADFANILDIEQDSFKTIRKAKGRKPKNFTLRDLKDQKAEYLSDEFFKIDNTGKEKIEDIAKVLMNRKVKKANRHLKDFTDSEFKNAIENSPDKMQAIYSQAIEAYNALQAYDKTGAKIFLVDDWLNAFRSLPLTNNHSGIPISIADAVEGTTSARYGYGHGIGYINEQAENTFVEPFAQLFTLSKYEPIREILEILVPNQLSVMDEFIKAVIK